MLPPVVTQHKDLHRVVAVVAPSPTDARVVRQRVLFDKEGRATRERHMVLVVIPGERFAVLLVGKDGGEKHRWTTPVLMKEIFGLVDAMPMRRREMGRESGD